MKKIIFLDIDGVFNSTNYFQKRAKKGMKEHQIDDNAVKIFRDILKQTGATVVLSSSWRGSNDNHRIIREYICDFYDITPRCNSGIRGSEIYMWINKNVPYEEKKNLRYVIIDDDGDMLLWQKDHFFQTKNKYGLTRKDATKIIKYLNRK